MEVNFSDIYKIVDNYQLINKDEFISGLKDLESLIGLEKTKSLILGQISYGLMLLDRKDLNRNKYMLHTLITGPPGVGKTRLAKILGKIWCSMGLLRTSFKDEDLTIKENSLVNNLDYIKDKVQVIKQILPDDVLHMKEIDNPEEEPILWRLDKIHDICSEFQQELQPSVITNSFSKFTKVTRADLIGKYQGHTAIMTQKVLNDAIGGVLFVDEAYQLMTSYDGNGDNFGSECLTMINDFMSEHPDKIIVIFGGYNDSMNDTIFRVQPGLKRRFNWHFNIESYTPLELSQIIVKQFTDESWTLESDVTLDWLCSIVTTNSEHFKSFGGDTQRLVFYSIIEHSIHRVLNPELKVGVITRTMILSALSKFDKTCKCDKSPYGMYL